MIFPAIIFVVGVLIGILGLWLILVVPLPPQQTARVTYVAKHAGIYPILCTIPKHLPMMSGQLIVLAGTSMAD